MNVHYGLPEPGIFYKNIVTQGTFDGVHTGHTHILNKMRSLAEKKQAQTALITFYPHPRHVLKTHANELKLLSTMEEKKGLLEQSGLDHLVILPFNEQMAQMDPEEFVANILVKHCKLDTLIVGYDHRFGKNRAGDYRLLKALQTKYHFNLEQITAQEIEEITISSTQIRKALLEGQIHLANTLLGRPYLMQAKVVEGHQIGRTLGFPTANLITQDPSKLIPQIGTYAVWVEYNNQHYKGMLNIGYNPTVEYKGFSIEVNIFNFAADLYNEFLNIRFIEKMRNEMKFDSLSALTNQLQLDAEKANQILNQYPL